MHPCDALEQLATVCATVSGLDEVNYPASDVAKARMMNLYWDETPIEDASEQRWLMKIRAQILFALIADAGAVKSGADRALVALVDAFRPTNRDAFHLVRPSGERVSHCTVKTLRPSLTIGGYYGAEADFEIKIRRIPELE